MANKHLIGISLFCCVIFSCGGRPAGTANGPSLLAAESATPAPPSATEDLEPIDLPASETVPFDIGQTRVDALVYKGKGLGLVLFNMHDDENTSVEAAKSFVKENGGTLVELRHSGQRLITFTLKKKSYKFDPNRIFTPHGVSKTLANYGGTSPEAEAEVARFAAALTAKFLSGPHTIVAMHNNTQGDYSIASYQQGGEYERDAAKVFVEPKNDTDNFFYVTDEKYFDLISAAGFNTILQNNSSVTDDGSLSVYCGQKQLRYINVEAEHGHRIEQAKMLRTLLDVLKSK